MFVVDEEKTDLVSRGWFEHERDNVISAVDPALIAVLRVYLGFLSALFGVLLLAFLGHQSADHAAASVGTMGAMTVVAVLGVSVGGIRCKSGHRGLAWLLTWLAAVPSVGQAVALVMTPSAWAKMAIELSILTLVPIVLLAWSTTFRIVVGVVTGLATVDCLLLVLAPVTTQERELQLHIVLVRTASLLLCGYVVARLAASERAQTDALRKAHAALAGRAVQLERLAVSRERNRIARELHDTLAHSLSGLAVQLEAIRCAGKDNAEQALRAVDDCLLTARSGLAEVRGALRELRASPIESEGLMSAVRVLAESSAERSGLELTCVICGSDGSLPEAVEHGVYRIAQEALSNVERHAFAKILRVELTIDSKCLKLVVVDDGRGFSTEERYEDRYGIFGMEERAELLHGRFELTSRPMQGTSVVFEVDISLDAGDRRSTENS